MTNLADHEIRFRADQEPSLLPYLDADTAVKNARSVGLDEKLADVAMYRHLLNSPQAARIVDLQKNYACVESELDPVIRELAIMRVAWNVGCEYVWVHHVAPMRISGLVLPEESRLKARLEPEDPSLSRLESLVLTLADEISFSRAATRETAKAVRALLPSDALFTDLVFATCYYLALVKMASTVGIPVEEHYTTWYPDGIAPPDRYSRKAGIAAQTPQARR